MSKYERISCHNFVEKNGYAYFSNWSYNGLFQVELKTGKTMFLGAFPEEKQEEFNIHWEVLLQGDSICFFPRRGRHIHIYSLADSSLRAVEIRKVSEAFFRVGEVVADGRELFLLPMEEKAPVRCFDLKTWAVTDRTDGQDIPQGVCLSKSRECFPDPAVLEKYQIEKAGKFSWMQMPQGRWCSFLPMGRQLLWYTPESQEIETVPLILGNEAELDAYLQPMRQACFCQEYLWENVPLTLGEYLKTLVLQTDQKKVQQKDDSGFPTGGSIWNYVKS